MANNENLKSWKPGQSGNPKGKPKGALHLSTRIQNLLNDPNFEAEVVDKKGNKKKIKGEPMAIILRTAALKAMNGDKTWADWLAKYAYGSKQIVEFEHNPIEEILEKYGLSDVTETKKEKQNESDDSSESERNPEVEGNS